MTVENLEMDDYVLTGSEYRNARLTIGQQQIKGKVSKLFIITLVGFFILNIILK